MKENVNRQYKISNAAYSSISNYVQCCVQNVQHVFDLKFTVSNEVCLFSCKKINKGGHE